MGRVGSETGPGGVVVDWVDAIGLIIGEMGDDGLSGDLVPPRRREEIGGGTGMESCARWRDLSSNTVDLCRLMRQILGYG